MIRERAERRDGGAAALRPYSAAASPERSRRATREWTRPGAGGTPHTRHCDRWGGKWDTGHVSAGIARQVGQKMGHRAQCGGDFGTGGAENGTPGSFRRGFLDRWGGKRDTGIISAWISRQVVRKMGHLERWEMKYWQNKQSANQCALRYSFISRKTILLYSITFLLKDILRA